VKELIDKLISQMVESGMFFQDAVTEFESKYIRQVLQQCGGNQSRAAKALGIHRNTLGRKMEEYHISARNGTRHAAKAAPRARKPK
jgi:DNA-binding NtrC family response regulator